jgi:hypothetical protein
MEDEIMMKIDLMLKEILNANPWHMCINEKMCFVFLLEMTIETFFHVEVL